MSELQHDPDGGVDEGTGLGEEFLDIGLDTPAPLPPHGPVQRPNGTTYHPRMLGDVEDVAFLRDARDHFEHVLFYGPPGTGKTALCETFHVDAPDTGEHLGFESIICGIDTTEGDFFGTYVQNPTTGNYDWSDGPLLRALRHGIPLYVDEIFLCDTRVLSATLYPVMDGRSFVTVPANPSLGRIPVPAGFFVMGAGNPDVPGADYSEALRSRFVHQVEVTSDWDLCRRLGVPRNIVAVARALDDKRRKGVLSWSPQTRDLLLYRDARDRLGQGFALSGLLGKTPQADRDEIAATLLDRFDHVTPLALGSPAPRSTK